MRLKVSLIIIWYKHMTKVAFNVVDANGNPEEGALIDIQLPEAGISEAGSVLPTSLKIKTNAEGKVDNSDGFVELEPVATVPYVVVITGANKKSKGIYKFIVPDLAALDPPQPDKVLKAEELFYLPPPSGESYDAAAIADITNERILAQAGRIGTPYTPIDTEFRNSGGVYTYTPLAGQANGFFIIDESTLSPATKEGTVLIPADDTTYFDDGTSFLFIRDNLTYSASPLNISFGGATQSVRVDPLGIVPVKLESASDVIQLIKVADNTWKIFNLTQGGGGEGGTGGFDAITQGTFNVVFGSINDIEGRISQILTAQTQYIDHLNVIEQRMSDNDAATSALNNAVASITTILAGLNATIDRKITEAVPGLGDLTAFVEASELARDIAIDNAVAAGNASESATQSAIDATNAKDAAQASETAITTALGNSNIISNSLADLVLLPYPEIQSSFLEGIDSPSQPEGTAQRYWFDPTSTAQINDKFSVESTDQIFVDARAAGTVSNEVLNTVILPTYEILGILDPLTPDDPGRWLALPIEVEELAKIDNGTDGTNYNRFLMTPDAEGDQPLQPVDRSAFKNALAITATNNANTTDVIGLGSNAFDTGYPAPPSVPYAWEILYSSDDIGSNVLHSLRDIFRTNHNTYKIYYEDWRSNGTYFEPWLQIVEANDQISATPSPDAKNWRLLEEGGDRTPTVDYHELEFRNMYRVDRNASLNEVSWRVYYRSWMYARGANNADTEIRGSGRNPADHKWENYIDFATRPTGFVLKSIYPNTQSNIYHIRVYGRK
jgi:hypothetical protein